MNQVFVHDTTSLHPMYHHVLVPLKDGRSMVNGNLPEFKGPVVLKPKDGYEIFILPPEWNARGYFIEEYCARYGTDVGLDEWLAKSGL